MQLSESIYAYLELHLHRKRIGYYYARILRPRDFHELHWFSASEKKINVVSCLWFIFVRAIDTHFSESKQQYPRRNWSKPVIKMFLVVFSNSAGFDFWRKKEAATLDCVLCIIWDKTIDIQI